MAIDSGRDINNSINGAGALAVDASGVNGLKRAAHQNPNSPEAIKGVAKQFEAMFLNMMMKSMRQATPQDLLVILQAMKAAGALRAELEII